MPIVKEMFSLPVWVNTVFALVMKSNNFAALLVWKNSRKDLKFVAFAKKIFPVGQKVF